MVEAQFTVPFRSLFITTLMNTGAGSNRRKPVSSSTLEHVNSELSGVNIAFFTT